MRGTANWVRLSCAQCRSTQQGPCEAAPVIVTDRVKDALRQGGGIRVSLGARRARGGVTMILSVRGEAGTSWSPPLRKGPRRSQLEVVRYSAEGLHGAFGQDFQLLISVEEDLVTPLGTHQAFVYCLCRH